MKKFLILIAVSMCTLSAFAGSNKIKEVKGTISSNQHEALVGAKVELEGTDIVVYTDFDGSFSIDQLKPGTYNIKISLISYQNLNVENVKLTVGLNKSLDFTLEER